MNLAQRSDYFSNSCDPYPRGHKVIWLVISQDFESTHTAMPNSLVSIELVKYADWVDDVAMFLAFISLYLFALFILDALLFS